MRFFDNDTLLTTAIERIRKVAYSGIWNGADKTKYLDDCIWHIPMYQVTIIYTREYGYHTGGWWKNPDYERCWHLSISFPGGKDKKVLKDILFLLFAPNEKLLWVEGPASDIGKQNDVWHYRLFCDEKWKPIMPRGEVYNTHFTEKGWKSFSELNKK